MRFLSAWKLYFIQGGRRNDEKERHAAKNCMGGGKSESTKKWKKIQTLYGLSQETLGAIFLLPFFWCLPFDPVMACKGYKCVGIRMDKNCWKDAYV